MCVSYLNPFLLNLLGSVFQVQRPVLSLDCLGQLDLHNHIQRVHRPEVRLLMHLILLKRILMLTQLCVFSLLRKQEAEGASGL